MAQIRNIAKTTRLTTRPIPKKGMSSAPSETATLLALYASGKSGLIEEDIENSFPARDDALVGDGPGSGRKAGRKSATRFHHPLCESISGTGVVIFQRFEYK